MTIRQLFFVPPVPLLVAEELGLLAAAGLDIESRPTRSSAEQLAGLRSDTVDVAVTAMDNVFVWNHLGADLRIVAQVEQTTVLSVYASPDHRTLADLDGATFAVDALTNGFAIVARTLLARAGVSARYVETGGVKERFDALLGGRADATLLGPPLDALADQAGMVRLASANEAFPALPGQGVVVRARRSPHETAELRAYLEVLRAAVMATESMTVADGIALLERHGFPGRSAADAWRTRPRSIAVDAAGLSLVEALRAQLDLLPLGYAGLDGILDASLAPARAPQIRSVPYRISCLNARHPRATLNEEKEWM
ncbi:ABC transporter substrate-binding protein [Georgenia thermotolerans]|uniref:ABC transporter substrate-binding protein n=1 Tax=Georgenia thermotolerans TaxID=527326 RepID=UPI0014793EED|nr:ABC transporter substrate-binding protein [Georgenia thermotolerans]